MSQRVLVVEDNETIRRLVVSILKINGYTVLSAPTADEALQFEGPFHLIITDLELPGMSGRELVQQLRPVYPEVRVVYMSGYETTGIKAAEWLEKPFTPDKLMLKVREALQQG